MNKQKNSEQIFYILIGEYNNLKRYARFAEKVPYFRCLSGVLEENKMKKMTGYPRCLSVDIMYLINTEKVLQRYTNYDLPKNGPRINAKRFYLFNDEEVV